MTDFTDMAGKNISSLTAYKPGKPIAELKRELGIQKIIKLASNENPFGPSPKVREALKNCLNEISRYPLGDAYDIRLKVADKYQVDPDELIFGAGSNELIELIMRTFLHKNDHVMSPSPSFSVYGITAKAMGRYCNWVKVDKNFHSDMNQLLNKITKHTRIIFLANPNNPLGTYINDVELEDFMSKIPDNILVVMDEAYIEFADAEDMPDTLALRKKYPNMILLRTFSKAYGLAGLRIGYGIGNKVAVNMLNRVRQPFNTNMLGQIGACAAIDDNEYLEKIIQENKKGKKQFYDGFDAIGLKYVKSQANFVLVRVGNGEAVAEALLKKGVIVRYMGPKLKPYIRVSIGTQEENEIFLKALKEVI